METDVYVYIIDIVTTKVNLCFTQTFYASSFTGSHPSMGCVTCMFSLFSLSEVVFYKGVVFIKFIFSFLFVVVKGGITDLRDSAL
jgi:hypothetical protein